MFFAKAEVLTGGYKKNRRCSVCGAREGLVAAAPVFLRGEGLRLQLPSTDSLRVLFYLLDLVPVNAGVMAGEEVQQACR